MTPAQIREEVEREAVRVTNGQEPDALLDILHGRTEAPKVVNLDGKRLATLKARAALAGFVIHDTQTDDGRPEWIVVRWSLCRGFTDLAELEAWLDRVAGNAH